MRPFKHIGRATGAVPQTRALADAGRAAHGQRHASGPLEC
jgi:hypothetical protein